MSQRYFNFEFEQSYTRRPPTSTGGTSSSSAIPSLLGDPPPPVRRQPQAQLYDPFDQDEMESTDSRYRASGTGTGTGADISSYRQIYDYEPTRTREREPISIPERGTVPGSSYSYSSSNTNSKLITASYGGGVSRERDNGHGHTNQPSSRTTDRRDPEPLFPRDSEYRNVNQSGSGARGETWRNRSPSPVITVSRRQSEYGNVARNSRRSPPPWEDAVVRRQTIEPLFKSENVLSRNPPSLMQNLQPQQLSAMGMGGPIQFLLPQGASGAASLMGMLPMGSQNQYGVQSQAPVQVILGNLPAFNSNLFEQQQRMMSNQYGSSVRGGQSHHHGREAHRSPGSHRREVDRNHRGNSRHRDNSPVHRTGGSVSRKASDRFGSSTTNLSPRAGRKREASEHQLNLEKKVPREGSGERVLRVRTGKKSPSKRDRLRKRRREQEQKEKEEKEKSEFEKKDKEPALEKEKIKEPYEAEIDASVTGDKEIVILDEITSSDKPKDAQTDEVEVQVIDEKEKEKKKSKYDEFPSALLVCKVCQKGMSDGASFENHLQGRAHYALLKIVEEKFQRRADLLMFESKTQEDEILIEMERLKRAGGLGRGDRPRGKSAACNMCNCNYSVNWGTHKVSYCHRVLKDFLHPTCHTCGTNFVHRMDWVNHLFSLAHLRRVYEIKLDGKDVSEHEKLTQDELFAVTIELKKDEKPTPYIIVRNSDWKAPSAEELKEMFKGENGELELPSGEIVLPEEYKEDAVVGSEAIITVEGKCCKVCRLYVGRTEKEVLAHCSGRSHYDNYVTYLKSVIVMQEKIKNQEAEAAAAEEAKKTVEESPMEVDAICPDKTGNEVKTDLTETIPTTELEAENPCIPADADPNALPNENVELKALAEVADSKVSDKVDSEIHDSKEVEKVEETVTQAKDIVISTKEETETHVEPILNEAELNLNDEEINELFAEVDEEDLVEEPETTNENEAEEDEKVANRAAVNADTTEEEKKEPVIVTVPEEKKNQMQPDTKTVASRSMSSSKPVQTATRGTPLGIRGRAMGRGSVVIRGALPKVQTSRRSAPLVRPPSSLARGGTRSGAGRGPVSARGGRARGK